MVYVPFEDTEGNPMSKFPFAGVVLALLACSTTGNAQSVQVNQQKRTIEIAATGSIEVTADRVTITVGYHSYAPTHDAVFAENARIGATILKAWKDAGVLEKEIATNSWSSPHHRPR
jgi:uncharacterized protein YggE